MALSTKSVLPPFTNSVRATGLPEFSGQAWKKIAFSPETRYDFSQPGIQKFMQTTASFSNFQPIVCGISKHNKIANCKGDYSFLITFPSYLIRD